MAEKKVKTYKRKVFRVGGSVVVPLPKELRWILSIGIGEYVKIAEGPGESIVIKKERKDWDGRIKRKD